MPCRQNKEPNGLTKVEERSRTKLQIELGLPTDLVVPEQVEEEAETTYKPLDVEEGSVQEITN